MTILKKNAHYFNSEFSKRDKSYDLDFLESLDLFSFLLLTLMFPG